VFLFPSSALVVACVLMVALLTGEIISQCHLDLHFLWGQGCWAFLHGFVDCTSSLRVVFQFIYPFVRWAVDSLRSQFLSSLYNLVANPSSDVLLDKIFHSVSCLFSLVTVSFAQEKLFSFMSSHVIVELYSWSNFLCLCAMMFSYSSCSSFTVSDLHEDTWSTLNW
jgi:hypothetical protein